MAEYTNDHDRAEIEELPERINVDEIGDVPTEDPEKLDNSDCPDTGTEEDDDPYGDWDDEADWNDDEVEEGSSDRDDEEVAESDSPRDRFSDFAGVSAALLSDALRSALSEESFRELEFGVRSGDTGAYFSIKTRR